MAKLKEKSSINLEAAGQLIKLNLYAPSIHCSYYSCYQLLRYAVKEFFGLDYESQDDNIRNSTQNSHSYLITYVSGELIKYVDVISERKFTRTLKDLKQLRNEADYYDVEIDSEKGSKAFQKAQVVRQFINEKLL